MRRVATVASWAPAVPAAIIAPGRECPHWGPRKLRAVLMRERPEVVWPAPSTVGDLLCSEGLVAHCRRHRRVAALCRSLRTVVAPNDVRCIDFKE